MRRRPENRSAPIAALPDEYRQQQVMSSLLPLSNSSKATAAGQRQRRERPGRQAERPSGLRRALSRSRIHLLRAAGEPRFAALQYSLPSIRGCRSERSPAFTVKSPASAVSATSTTRPMSAGVALPFRRSHAPAHSARRHPVPVHCAHRRARQSEPVSGDTRRRRNGPGHVVSPGGAILAAF